MAKKTNAFKTSLEARGSAAASNRQSMPSTTALYLAQLLGQLRPHAFKLPPSGVRQQIAIQIEEQSLAPRVVKIIHTDSN
jgi:hypothetical protein